MKFNAIVFFVLVAFALLAATAVPGFVSGLNRGINTVEAAAHRSDMTTSSMVESNPLSDLVFNFFHAKK